MSAPETPDAARAVPAAVSGARPAVRPGADERPSMPADIADLLVAFARTCKAAARAVVLYPPEHPAVGSALLALGAAGQAATARGPLTVSVAPAGLLVGGSVLPKPDLAAGELAALLYAHQVGEVTIHPQADVDTWRRFLPLLAIAPDQARLRGGLARLWSSEGESQIGVRRIDFAELLRDRLHGDRATWDRIAAECLEGNTAALDTWTADLITELLATHSNLGDLVSAIHERVTQDGDGGQAPAVLAGLLHAVSEFASRSQAADRDTVLAAMADATGRLPISSVGSLMRMARTSSGSRLGRFVIELAQRIQDGTIADMVATEVRGGRGTTPALGDAFCGLAPDPSRRATILNLSRRQHERLDGVTDAADAARWQQSEEFLLTYSDERFVSEAYGTELDHIGARAVDLEQDHTDPASRIAHWAHTVDDAAVRLLDAQVLVDLMLLQADVHRWRELADLAISRIDMLVVVGDFASASFLVGAMHHQALQHDEPAIRTAAGAVLDLVSTPALMRHVAAHLDTTDKPVITAAQRFCHAIGTAIVGPLAEVLSREERMRPRQHLIEILLGLGAAGRQAVERLKQSPNSAVRRTAVLLLREFGGNEALGDLESLLRDAEPHVQRDATRAIAMMHSDAAYDMLTHALATGRDRTRTTIVGVLTTIPDDDALPLLAYLVRHAPCRGPMWPIFERFIQRLGAIGGRPAVDALSELMYKRVVWAPFKVAVLRRLAADALARIAMPEAADALRTAAAGAPRGARAAARRHVAGLPAHSYPRERSS